MKYYETTINSLEKGLLLENLNVLIPWYTSLQTIDDFGHPDLIKHSEQRTDAVWKNVEVLGGIKVNLTAIFGRRLFGKRKFRYLIAYLDSLEEVESLNQKLNIFFNQDSQKRIVSKLEFYNYWKIKNCKIKIGQRERFSFYYYLEIQR